MAGHSKWATIKRAKGAADAKRGRIFTKINKEISIAARMGGGDPDTNPRLRTAILKARGANMPKDNVERAIKKGTGELGGSNYEELVYEAYAPGGVAILIEVLTDNKNRTAADVRSTLTKAGGSLATTGAVSRLFRRQGVVTLDSDKYTEDDIMELALENGAEDIESSEEVIEIFSEPENFESLVEALNAKEIETLGAEISMLADTEVSLGDEQARKIMNLVGKLEDFDDVQNVYHNLDVPEDLEEDA